jgi:hypothetical protein
MTTTNITGIRISDRNAETITIRKTDTVNEIQQAIGARWFDVVSLNHHIDLYVDDEGAINGSTLNLPATIIAHTLGTPAALFGTVVVLGIDNETGESVSLTDEQAQHILHALARQPDVATIDRLCETLSPIVQIVDATRSV